MEFIILYGIWKLKGLYFSVSNPFDTLIVFLKDLFDLILYVPVNNFFSYVGMGLLGLTRIKVSGSRTQYSDVGEAQTHNPSISRQALYDWANELPFLKEFFEKVNSDMKNYMVHCLTVMP